MRVGTRSSPLALAQATSTIAALQAALPEHDFQLVATVSKGDRDLRPFAQIDQRGLFAGELEQAIATGELDAAIHSCKDLRPDDSPGLAIGAYLPRAAPHDVLIGAQSMAELVALDAPVVATGSARRTAQLLEVFHRLGHDWGRGVTTVPIRGNVGTRLEKFPELGAHATILARAGLDRLGIDLAARALPHHDLVEEWVGDPGQGAVVVQVRADDTTVDWARVDDPLTRVAVEAERAIAQVLGGGCERPVGVHVEIAQGGAVHVSFFAALDDAGSAGRPGALRQEVGVGALRDPLAIAAAVLGTVDQHDLEALRSDTGR